MIEAEQQRAVQQGEFRHRAPLQASAEEAGPVSAPRSRPCARRRDRILSGAARPRFKRLESKHRPGLTIPPAPCNRPDRRPPRTGSQQDTLNERPSNLPRTDAEALYGGIAVRVANEKPRE